MKKLVNKACFASLLLAFLTVVDASVTWRRVTRPMPVSTESILKIASSTTTKSPITWKRSTLTKRSTDKLDHPPMIEEEDIEAASSNEETSILAEDSEQEPSYKPLVPGSRPGFWFDSSRRKKPAALLKLGSRKSNLFPSKASTIQSNTTKTKVTTAPTTPETHATPTDRAKTTSNPKAKLFGGRNRTTKPSIVFRKRVKTTTTAKPTTTASEKEEIVTEKPLKNAFEIVENDEDGVSSDPVKTTENLKRKPYDSVRLPGLGIRRKAKNGTRISWNQDRSRFRQKSTSPSEETKSTTTAALTTTPTLDTWKSSRRSTYLPKLRARPKASRTSTPNTNQYFRQSTMAPTTVPTTIKPYGIKQKGPTPHFRHRKVHKFNRLKPTPFATEKDEDETYTATTIQPVKVHHEASLPTIVENEISSSTVEPFYMTREFGEVVAAVTESSYTKGDSFTLTKSPSNEFVPVVLPKKFEENEDLYSVEMNTTWENSYEEDEKIDGDVSKPFELSKIQRNEDLELTSSSQAQRNDIFTTNPPKAYPPQSHTTDPGSNAYVVWRLGQDGNGWSYENQGGLVKWSAQNSQAENDRWSVQSKEEKEAIKPILWSPERNLPKTKKTETAQKIEVNEKTHLQNVKEHKDNPWKPITYIPSIPYKNETVLKIGTTPSDFQSTSFPDFNAHTSLLPNYNLSFLKMNESKEVTSEAIYNSPLNKGNETLVKPTNKDDRQNITKSEGVNVSQLLNPSSNTGSGLLLNPDEFAESPRVLEYTTKDPIVPFRNNKESQFHYSYPTTEINPFFQVSDAIPYDVITPQPYFLGGDLPSSVKGTNQQAIDLSGIPPELSKAVIDAKRWTILGTGGTEGWSLIGEDGSLEWKIYNTNGKWTVISADQLLNVPLQIRDEPMLSFMDKVNETDGFIKGKEELKVNSPKVWTLADDYEKWKLLSSEGGVEVESAERKAIPSNDYDYDQSEDSEEDYYDDDDDDDYSTPVYPLVNHFEDRPLWQAKENWDIHAHRQENPNHLPLSGGIESANTKGDAIAAWKALIADRDHGNLSENEATTWKTEQEKPYSKPNPSRDISSDKLYSIPNSPRDFLQENFSKHNPPKDISQWKDSRPTLSYHQKVNKVSDSDIQIPVNNAETDDRNTFEVNNSKRKVLPAESIKPPNNQITKEKERTSILRPKDSTKIDALINKLETVKNQATGRAVVDLSQLLKLIKENRNSTSDILKGWKNSDDTDDSLKTHTESSQSQDRKQNYLDENKKENQSFYDKVPGNKNTVSLEKERPPQSKDHIEYNKFAYSNPPYLTNKNAEEIKSELPKVLEGRRIYYGKGLGEGSLETSPFNLREKHNQKYSFGVGEVEHEAPNGDKRFNEDNKFQIIRNRNRNFKENNKENNFQTRLVPENEKNREDIGSPEVSPFRLQEKHNQKVSFSGQKENKTPYDDKRTYGHQDKYFQVKGNVNRNFRENSEEGQFNDESNDHKKLRRGPEPPEALTFNLRKRQKQKLSFASEVETKGPFDDKRTYEHKDKYFQVTGNGNRNFRGNGKEDHFYGKPNLENEKLFLDTSEESETYLDNIKNKNPEKLFEESRSKIPYFKETVKEVNQRNFHHEQTPKNRLSDGLNHNEEGYGKGPNIYEEHQTTNDGHSNEAYHHKYRAKTPDSRRTEEGRMQSYGKEGNEQPFSNGGKPRFLKARRNRKRFQTGTGKSTKKESYSYEGLPEYILKENSETETEEKDSHIRIQDDYVNLKQHFPRNKKRKIHEVRHKNRHDGERYPYGRHSRPQILRETSSSEETPQDVRNQYQSTRSFEHKKNVKKDSYETETAVTPVKDKHSSARKRGPPPPIVISTETEYDDDEDGSKKSRKIIVIDYAGQQKKKSPVDRKDLELIIRSVKHRRSEMMEEPPREIEEIGET